MNFLRDLSIRKKILLIPTFGAIGFISYLLVSIHFLNGSVELLNDARVKQFPLLQLTNDNIIRVEKIQETFAYAVTSGEADVIDTAENIAIEFRANIQESKEIDGLLAKRLEGILDLFDSYYNQSYSISKGMLEDTIDYSTLGSRGEEMARSLKALKSTLSEFHDARLGRFNNAFVGANEASSKLIYIGLGLGVATITLLFLVAIPISGMVTSSVVRVIDCLKDIAEDNGDLTVRIQSQGGDEIGELVKWFNTFMDKLQVVIQQIVETVPPLTSLANNVSSHSSDIAEVISEQNKTVNESRANIELMSQSVAGIAMNAKKAANSAKTADEEAVNGRTIVSRTVAGITNLSMNINDASDAIAKLEHDAISVNVVLEVIRGIAEQTNLLALNAAIEAARAGEQGRGFAVVADEVRSLASRTQDSTEEINTILAELQSASQAAVRTMSSSTQAVGKSVEEANLAGGSLETITETVNTISAMNEQIAHATNEQKSISAIMVKESECIHEQTLKTSVAAEQLSDVSENLNSLAINLEKITKQFNV